MKERKYIIAVDRSWSELCGSGGTEVRDSRVLQTANGREEENFGKSQEMWKDLDKRLCFQKSRSSDWADTFYVVTLPARIRKPRLLPNLPLPLRSLSLSLNLDNSVTERHENVKASPTLYS